MSEGRKPGRPRKEGFVLYKIFAPATIRDYLERIRATHQLPDRSSAGEFVLTRAAENDLFLGTDATVASE